jgi:Vps52 / Sac2 family
MSMLYADCIQFNTIVACGAVLLSTTTKQGNSHDTFNKIFERTLQLCYENLETYLFSSHDAIGLLLIIKLTHAYR